MNIYAQDCRYPKTASGSSCRYHKQQKYPAHRVRTKSWHLTWSLLSVCSAHFWSDMLSYAAFCRMPSFTPDFSALSKIAF